MSQITTFKVSAKHRKPLWDCMKNHGVGERSVDWPNNMISTKTVVYENGEITRRGDAISFNVDSSELSLCKTLSEQAKTSNPIVHFDFGSESCARVWPFYIAASVSVKPPKRITPKRIRQWFGGTIFPMATITVEPMKDKGIWWSELLNDKQTANEPLEPLLEPYWALCEWFSSNPDFVHSAFVRIGDRAHLSSIPRKDYPAGTSLDPSLLPRMAAGAHKNGQCCWLVQLRNPNVTRRITISCTGMR